MSPTFEPGRLIAPLPRDRLEARRLKSHERAPTLGSLGRTCGSRPRLWPTRLKIVVLCSTAHLRPRTILERFPEPVIIAFAPAETR